MEKSYIRTAIIVSMFCGAIACETHAATTTQINGSRLLGLKWLLLHQETNGSWKGLKGFDGTVTSAAVDALGNSGITGFPYARAISWLANAESGSVDTLSRQISALKNAGFPVAQYVNTLKNWQNSQSYATWGAYDHYATSFPDTPLALGALRAARFSSPTFANEVASSVYCKILPAQKTDGGWSYTPGITSTQIGTSAATINPSVSSMLPTSYTILELYATRVAYGWDTATCGTKSYTLTTAISNGVNWVKGQKNTDGGFGAGGVSTVLETALAYQVLQLMAPTDFVTTGALDYLIANQNSTDGSWNGDAFQTAFVLKQLPLVALPDADSDGVPDGVETLMGKNPTVADSRWMAANNTRFAMTSTALVMEGTVRKPFSATLPAAGGTSPYTFTILTGALPAGLLLAQSTGVISGTPTTEGSYEFAYLVSDVKGNTTSTTAIIKVLPVPYVKGDVNRDGVVDNKDTAILVVLINMLLR